MSRRFLVLLALAACSSGPDPDVNSPHPYGRYLGALELAEHPDPKNVQKIVSMLDDPEPLVRSGAVVSLSQIGKPEYVQHLTPRLDVAVEASAMVRSDVCIALGRIKNPASVAPLLNTLAADPEPVVRREAAKALVAFGKKPDLLQGLVKAVSDPDVSVAWRAHVSLQELTNAKGVAMTEEAWTAYLKDHP